ncbi:MAG: hypothetical protein H6713_08700 [Myxococcales bacterium]|nr:hypothetical protein [Myxococcales bacterium]MCB9750067.1 hypothetical protein [Myxococcales bacterium]
MSMRDNPDVLLRVKLRNFTIAEAVTPRDASPIDGQPAWFLPLESPPPVGSLLSLSRDSAGAEPPLAFEVRRNAVLEELGRGCVGVEVDLARLEELANEVGSEHLEPEPAPASMDAAAAAHEVLVLADITDDEPPLATGGGKLRKGRSRA